MLQRLSPALESPAQQSEVGAARARPGRRASLGLALLITAGLLLPAGAAAEDDTAQAALADTPASMLDIGLLRMQRWLQAFVAEHQGKQIVSGPLIYVERGDAAYAADAGRIELTVTAEAFPDDVSEEQCLEMLEAVAAGMLESRGLSRAQTDQFLTAAFTPVGRELPDGIGPAHLRAAAGLRVVLEDSQSDATLASCSAGLDLENPEYATQ